MCRKREPAIHLEGMLSTLWTTRRLCASVLLWAVAAHQLEQAVEVERFLQEGGPTEIGGPRLIERRQDDDGDVGELGIRALAAAELPAVHHGHHQVEQDEIGAVTFFKVVEGVAAVRDCFGPESLERQQLRHHLPQVGVVFDDEDGAVPGEAWTARMRESSRLNWQALRPAGLSLELMAARARATSPSWVAMIRREALGSNSAVMTVQERWRASRHHLTSSLTRQAMVSRASRSSPAL